MKSLTQRSTQITFFFTVSKLLKRKWKANEAVTEALKILEIIMELKKQIGL